MSIQTLLVTLFPSPLFLVPQCLPDCPKRETVDSESDTGPEESRSPGTQVRDTGMHPQRSEVSLGDGSGGVTRQERDSEVYGPVTRFLVLPEGEEWTGA